MGELRRADPTIDAVLSAHAAALGDDLSGYRNHVYRVLNFAVALAPARHGAIDKLATAAVFHDLGIWTAATFDYLPPSIDLAVAHLQRYGRPDWVPEVAAMIREHHKITAYRGRPDWLVEPFRRADWIDVTFGVRRFGLGRTLVAAVRAAWPDDGFHWRLVELTARRTSTHPFSPLPMLRW